VSRRLRLRGTTAAGDAVTVDLWLSHECAICRGRGSVMDPEWETFVSDRIGTGLPMAEIIRVYGPAHWEGREPPPVEAACTGCNGTGEAPTNDARALAAVLEPLMRALR